MKVSLTGATGIIGSTIVPELLEASHQDLGFARSDAGAEALKADGADVHRESLVGLDSPRSGAGQSDGVIHCAFNNDVSKFQESNEQEHKDEIER